MSAINRLHATLERFRDCGARPGMFEEGERALADLELLEAEHEAVRPLVDPSLQISQREWNGVMSALAAAFRDSEEAA